MPRNTENMGIRGFNIVHAYYRSVILIFYVIYQNVIYFQSCVGWQRVEEGPLMYLRRLVYCFDMFLREDVVDLQQ